MPTSVSGEQTTSSLFDLPLGRDAVVHETAGGAVRRVRHADGPFGFESRDEVTTIVNLSARHRVEGRFGGRWESQTPATGMVTVLPPGLRCDFVVAGECRVVMLRLPGAAVARAADEVGLEPLCRPMINERCDELKRLILEAAASGEVPLSAFARALARHGRPVHPPRRRGGLAPGALRRVLAMVQDDIAGDLSLATLASEARISVFHFARAFHDSTGYSPHRYVVARRVDHALELLAEPGQNVGEVARRSGFTHASHLARAMRCEIGRTPTEVRARILP